MFKTIPDIATRVAALQTGAVDIIGEGGIPPAFITQLERDPSVRLSYAKGGATNMHIGFEARKGAPLADRRVRLAIAHAIDVDAIVKNVLGGRAQKTAALVTPYTVGYDPAIKGIPYDPEAAKKLLADAGEKNLSLTLTMPSFYGTTVPQLLVSDLNKVGITLKVNSVDFPTWLQDVYTNKDYQLSLVDHAEARDFENWANPDYYFTYDNPKVQSLYAQSLAATTDTQASDLLKQAARIVSEDMAADWLSNWNSVVAVGANVTGMPIDNVNARINAVDIAKSKG